MSARRRNQVKGFLALLGAAILFGSTGAFVKVLSDYYTEPGQLIVRSAIATLLVILLARLMRVKFAIHRRQAGYLVAISLLYALSTSCFIYAVTSTKPSSALFMLYVGVIVATQIIGTILFREKFGRKSMVTLLLLGVSFILYVQPFAPNALGMGLYIACAGGVFEAITYAVRKRREDLTKESITAAQSLGGLAIGVFFLATQAKPIFHESLNEFSIIAMLVLGLIYVGIGYLITYGMRHYSLGIGSVVLSTDMLFALIINAIVLGQNPTVNEIVGSMLLLACVVYTTDFSSNADDESNKEDSVEANIVLSPEAD